MMLRLRDRSHWSDAELLAAVAACDDRAFSVFYRRHLGVVVGWAMRRTGDPASAGGRPSVPVAAVVLGR